MVPTRYVLCFFAFFALTVYGDDEAAVNQQEADDYLEKFGYLDGMKQRSGNPFQRQLARARAIKTFQEFADLPVTGRLDEETQRKMLAPRCGMTDSRTRAGVSKWRKNQLTWAYVQPTTQIASASVKSAIKESLAIWAQVVPLTFTEVSPQSRPDMVFGFAAKDHGDGSAFDGKGRVLAHAFFPENGRLHFDNDEIWAYQDASKVQRGYIDLLSVTIHELGHALGLPHTNSPGAIMNAFYRRPDIVNGKMKPFVLSTYDIQDIQAIYGRRGRVDDDDDAEEEDDRIVFPDDK